MPPPDDVPLTPAPPPKKKRRWKRRALAVVALLLLVAVWLAPGVLARSGYKDKLLADLTADVNGRVTAGELSLNWLHPVEAFDVTVTDPDGRPVLAAKKVGTSKTLLALLLNRSDPGTVRVERPTAEVRFENGTTNVRRVFARYFDAPAGPTRTPVSVEVTDGTVRLTDVARNQTTELTAVGGTATIPADPAAAIAFNFGATAGGPIKVEGEIGSGGKLAVEASEFDLAAVAPAVRHFAPEVAVGGRVRSKVNFAWTPREKGLPAFSADGDVTISDATLAAPPLGRDPVRLKSADMPVSAAFDGRTLTVSKLRLTCDAGTVGFAGGYDTAAAPDAALNRAGMSFDADIDLAKLAAAAPGLLRLKPGTEILRGRLTAKVASGRADSGTGWSGSVVASKIEGRRDGRAVNWDHPLTVTFAARVPPAGLPTFDTLTVQSDFIGGQARGTPDSFDAIANLDLDILSRHLDDLFDLNGLKLRGTGKELLVRVRPAKGGGWTLTAGGSVLNLAVSDASGVLVADPHLTLDATASGTTTNGTVRIDSGQVDVSAGTDTLAVRLVQPMTDVRALATGSASVALTGDLARWRGRVGKLVGWPTEWDIGGTATEATAVVSLGEVMTAEHVKVIVTNATFRGFGLVVDEPTLRVESADQPAEKGSITYQPATGAVGFAFTRVTSDTVNAAISRLRFAPNAKGEYGGEGKAMVVARLDRVQKALQLQSAKDLSDQFRGRASGRVELTAPTFDRLDFVTDLTVTDLQFGPPAAPAWAEPWLKVRGGVGYLFSTDTLTLSETVVERDGFTASGSGTVARLGTEPTPDVSGSLGYDLAKLEPVLKTYLGKSAAAAGKDTRPFRIAGPVTGSDLTRLSGSAGVSWASLRAYGFEVGRGGLTATAERGRITGTPVRATFGGGTVTAEPTVRLTPGAYDFTFTPGRVVEKATLTPAVCAEALGYALPALANAAQADGVVSFDLGANGFPLADPAAGSFKGTLTVHEGTVSPGPVITQLLDALGIAAPKVELAKNTAVPVELKNGRVTHSNFTFLVGNTPVATAGSVGTDGTLDLIVSLPVGGAIAEKLLPNQPALQKAVAKQSVSVKVRGTLTKPQLDADGLRGQLQAIVKGAAKDAIQDKGQQVVDDLFQKGLDKLFKKK